MSIFSKPAKATSPGGMPMDSGFILEAIQDGVVMINKDGLIEVFNPAASAITGWKAEEAVGLDYHTILQLVDSKGPSNTRPKPSLHPNFSVWPISS